MSRFCLLLLLALHTPDKPFELAHPNAAKLGGKMPSRMVVGGSDRLVHANDKLHRLPTELNIPHDYIVLVDVDHDLFKIMRRDQDGSQGFSFAARYVLRA